MLIEKRKAFGLSQGDVARILELSRPTIVKIEKGERLLSQEETQKLKTYFETLQDENELMRINIPQKNIEKFKQIFLYILEKVGARPNVGLTVLYKLLYFIDFDYYEKYEEQLMGLTYIKNHYGPTPREFVKVVDTMIKDGKVKSIKWTPFMQYEQTKYLPVKAPDLRLLNGRELGMIESVLERYADKNAQQISDLSHRDTPWKATRDGEDIDYELAFYRPDEFSVREYDDL